MFGRRVALFDPAFQWAFPQLVHELNPSQGSLGSVGRCEPQHGANDLFHGAMILLHEVVEILALLDGDGGSMLLVVAPNGRGIDLAPIDGDRLGDTMATGRLGEEARGRLLVALRREQEIDGSGHSDPPRILSG